MRHFACFGCAMNNKFLILAFWFVTIFVNTWFLYVKKCKQSCFSWITSKGVRKKYAKSQRVYEFMCFFLLLQKEDLEMFIIWYNHNSIYADIFDVRAIFLAVGLVRVRLGSVRIIPNAKNRLFWTHHNKLSVKEAFFFDTKRNKL